MVSSQSTTGSNGEKERSSWNCVLAVEEVSRREYLLSNKDMWDKGCRGAKKKVLELTELEVSLTLARPPTQFWASKVLGRYTTSKGQKSELLGPLSE